MQTYGFEVDQSENSLFQGLTTEGTQEYPPESSAIVKYSSIEKAGLVANACIKRRENGL